MHVIVYQLVIGMRVEYFASRRSIEKSINEEAKINDTRQWQKHKTRVKKFHLQFTDARSLNDILKRNNRKILF